MLEQSLLDLLVIQMKCDYISDLRFLSQGQRQYLAQKLNALAPREEDIREWNDALVYGNGIEKATVTHAPTPEDLFEAKQQQEQLYAAVMSLPEKQAKRLYAHFYLGMTPVEIAHAEGVDPGSVRRSIRNGLKRLAKKFG